MNDRVVEKTKEGNTTLNSKQQRMNTDPAGPGRKGIYNDRTNTNSATVRFAAQDRSYSRTQKRKLRRKTEGMARAKQVPSGGRSQNYGTSGTGHFNRGE